MRNQLPKLYNAVSAPVSVTREALAERLQSVRKTVSLLYNRMMENMDDRDWKISWEKKQGKKKPRSNSKKKEDIDLTPHEHEKYLKGAYRSFVVPGAPKTDIIDILI